MKILYLNYMNSSLATMIRSLELAKAVAGRGHKVTFVFMHKRFNPPPFLFERIRFLETETLMIRHVPRPAIGRAPRPGNTPAGKVTECKPSVAGLLRQSLGSFRYVPKELELLREIRPDVVVARPDHVLSFVVSLRLFGIPLVLETDGPVEELDYYWGISSRWMIPIDTVRARGAGAILYISEVCRALWEKKGFPSDRLFCCPNGADPDMFRPGSPEQRVAARGRLAIKDSVVIGFSGNQRQWHGLAHLFRAAVPLLRENPRVKILIIGMIEDWNVLGLENIPRDLVGRQIVFTGPVPFTEMPDRIDLADLMVMPYPQLDLFHFSPMKMFEALSMGKILVAPRQGQISDFLATLDSACLYDPRNPEALSAALRRAIGLVENGSDGSAGRDLLIREHSWSLRGQAVEEACLHAIRSQG